MNNLSPECVICAEKYNRKNRIDVKCPYCEFNSCRECCEKYILEQPFPKCMNVDCGKEWTRNFLRKTFTSKFINKTYKIAREQILYEHELSLLPATQYLVEREIEKENIMKDIMQLNQEQEEIRKKINRLYVQHNRISRGETAVTEHNEHTLYVRKCSDSECRGYLSSQWKCGVCSTWTCKNCHENIGKDRNIDHTCDPNNVATAELISKETKPCPKCATNIFKIDGCDQMWCTQCNTAFSWRTGQITLDEIHNPHYFEWLYRNRNNQEILLNDVRNNCDEIRVNNQFINILFSKTGSRTTTSDEYRIIFRHVTELCRGIMHLRHAEITRYNYDKTVANRDLRVLYMRNMIEKEYFKIVIQQNDKRHQKCRDMTNILTMLANTVSDIIIRLSHTNITIQDMKNHIREVNEIIKYVNECLEEVSHTYNSVHYKIYPNLTINKCLDKNYFPQLSFLEEAATNTTNINEIISNTVV
jgi:hypothetical protein